MATVERIVFVVEPSKDAFQDKLTELYKDGYCVKFYQTATMPDGFKRKAYIEYSALLEKK